MAKSDDHVYYAGDVSEAAKFTLGSFNNWINLQLQNSPELKSKDLKYTIYYSFIVGKDGKVRDAHMIKESSYPEINSAFEKILSQIPDWEPAKREGNSVSVFYHVLDNGTLTYTVKD